MATKKTTKKSATKKSSKKKASEITDEQLSSLQELGYDGSSDEEEAKNWLIEFLKKNDLDGVEEQDFETLVDMAVLFEPEDGGEEEESDDEEDSEEGEAEEEESGEEEEDDEEEDGEFEEDPEEEEEDEGDDEEEDSEELDEDDFEEEGEEEEKPKAKKENKKEKASAKKSSDKKRVPGDFVPFDFSNKSHLAVIKPILDAVSDKKKFKINSVKNGFTVYYLGKNTAITIFAFCKAKVDLKKKLAVGSFNVTRIKDVEEFLNIIPKKYREENISKFLGESNVSFRGATSTAVDDILNHSKFLDISIKKAESSDKNLGENRKRLEASLAKEKGSKKKEVKKVVKEKETPKTSKNKIVEVKSKKEKSAKKVAKKKKK